ncbi:hypothetical protein RND81_04G210000 [Saponaria officinalis]|uniref:Uncharacterized protein n=2 Tax=Saponaria officinalis TaxID=3572 RepID=A0AAW1LK59_SAPOF
MINFRKLLHREKVEVRQLEDGLKGSWHSGVVVGVTDSCRDVRYDELLCESGSSKLVESIPVTGAIEGLYQRPCVKSNYRGRIRPLPPRSESCSLNSGLKYGVCVDVLYKEAWWEGVIFDSDEASKKRLVYFPDENDVRVFKIRDIRVTLEWDEFSGKWKERGVWLLINLAREYKKDGNLFQFIRRVWSLLKVHYGYQKMISEWTCGAYCLWKEYFREVIYEITTKPTVKAVVFPATSNRHVAKERCWRTKRNSYLNGSVLTRSMQRRKNKEVNLQVKTRRMCMNEPENSPISAATKGSRLPDFRCRQNHSTAAETRIITECPTADASGDYDQVASVCSAHLRDCAMENGNFFQGRTAQNHNLHRKPPCCYGNHSKMSLKNHFRRKWRSIEKGLPPRKLKLSKISHVEAPTCHNSKMTRRLRKHVSLQVLDYESVIRRKKLMQTQTKFGFIMRHSALRQGRRRRIFRRSIKKNRSLMRIQKISSTKGEGDTDKSKATLSAELEASKSSRKEENVLGNRCGSVLPVADSCQELGSEDALNNNDKHMARRNRYHDSVCLICQYGDELLDCDRCMSSYHLYCVDVEEATTSGGLFCPCCRCGVCDSKFCASDDKLFTDVCYQCSRQYHFECLHRAGISVSEDSRFCSKSCFEICARLHQFLQDSYPTPVEGLSWTITRSRRNDCNVYNERVHPLIQASQALNVFHECFQPITEPHTGRDLVADIVYNSGSKLRRLDFHGFYVMALVDGDQLACAATVRIHGQKVAEMPLIATPFKYRRQGMCRLLLHELEKMLVDLGVERLVLPGIAKLSETWVSSFGFTEMPASVRRELLGYPFVVFQGTTMFQKIPSRSFEDTSKCATSSSNKCGVRQIDTTRRVLRPITRTRSKNRCNRELGCSQESMKLDRERPEHSQDNCSKNESRMPGQYHKRRKQEAVNKVKAVIDGSDKNLPTSKCIYKRRRIQATRNSSECL